MLLGLGQTRQRRHREKIGKRNRKSEALATGSHPFASCARIFFRSLEEARVFPPLARERRGEPPFHLPSHDSSQFFFELFVSNFTSPPCHATSFFFFPVYPSAIRGVDELALRVLPLPSRFSTTLILLSALPSQFLPYLSLSPSLLVSSPFSSISRPSFRPSPSFFLSLGRFIASSTTLRSPPSTPLPNLFPLSLRALVPFTHSLFPSRLRRYFLSWPLRFHGYTLPFFLFLSPYLPSFFSPQR